MKSKKAAGLNEIPPLSITYIYDQPKLNTMNINKSNKTITFKKRQEADDNPQKLWQMKTMQMV